jgi:hypothetical protein
VDMMLIYFGVYADWEIACAMCGKPNAKTNAAAPVVAGQKFTLK